MVFNDCRQLKETLLNPKYSYYIQVYREKRKNRYHGYMFKIQTFQRDMGQRKAPELINGNSENRSSSIIWGHFVHITERKSENEHPHSTGTSR